jgi:hypothetical protein
MTNALVVAFPDTPPYGGMFDDIIPHLSVADQDDFDLLAEIETDVKQHLPIVATARQVELVVHHPGGWQRHRSIDLAE